MKFAGSAKGALSSDKILIIMYLTNTLFGVVNSPDSNIKNGHCSKLNDTRCAHLNYIFNRLVF